MNLWIGFSALQTSQFAINNVSQNVANASTDGYHRQDVGLQTSQSQRISGQLVGSGVEVSHVRRLRDQIVEGALTSSIGDLEAVNQQLQIESTIESFLLPGEGSIQNALTGMLDGLGRLSANPSENALRNSALNQANNLAQRIQSVSGDLVELKHNVHRQIDVEVETVNQDLKTLVDLQNRIQSTIGNGTPNDLLDQRDRLINSLAERIDIQRYESTQSGMGLSIAGSSISIGAVAVEFETVTNDEGKVEIQLTGSDRDVKFQSGKIAALTDAHNNLISDYSGKVNEFASALIRSVNQAHAKGVGLDGPFSVLQSTTSIEDADAPLAESATFPMKKGELILSITSPDNERRTESISIDPETDSLRDIAAKISGIDNLQGVVDEETNQLSIIARPGYRFDFSGNLETAPDTANFTGTSVPRIAGIYSGETNRAFSVTALGDGEIGKTPGLTAQVADQNGNIVKEINIGEGYEAGSDIDIGNGVSVQLGAGGINTTDTFDVVLVADSDSTGALAGLGLNGFFGGWDATDISVRPELLENPTSMATSKTGEIGDTSNLAKVIEVRDLHLLGDQQMTFDDFLAETNAEIGFRVQSSQSVQVSVSEINFQYQSDRDSISGVDINEELLNLTRHQKSYEAAVQVVRTMESMLDDLFQIIR